MLLPFPEIIGTSAHKKIGIDKIHECLNLIANTDNISEKEVTMTINETIKKDLHNFRDICK